LIARVTTFFLFGVGIAAILVPLVPASSHPDGPAHVDTITAANGYTNATIAFSHNAFTNADGTGPLVAGDFTVTNTDATTPPTISSVSGSDKTWTLTFSAAAKPHITQVALNANAVYQSGGTAFGQLPTLVPLSAIDLTKVVTATKNLPLPMQDVAPPLIGDWFDQDRKLTDVVSGMSAVTSDGVQANVETGLEALPGVSDAVFSDGTLTLEFTDSETTGVSPTMSGGFELDPAIVDLALQGAFEVPLSLDGAITFTPTASGADVDTTGADNLLLGFDVDPSDQVDLDGHLGFVDVAAPDTGLDLDGSIAIDLTCSGGGNACGTADVRGTPTTSGTADLTIPQIDVTDGDATATYAPPSGDLLVVHWSDLGDLGSVSATADQLGDVEAGDLRNFTRISATDVTTALSWLSAWMTEVEKHGTMAKDLPIVGGTAGEASALAASLAQATNDLSETMTAAVEAAGDGTLVLTGQELAPLMCESGLVDQGSAATCADLLEPLSITPGEIEYAIHLESGDQLFSEGPPPVDLGFDVAGLDGITLNVGTGNWSGDVDTSFDFTLGFKISSASDLEDELDLDGNDYDDDGTPNASDADADGDGLADASADADDDADNLPENYTLVAGDRCRGLAGFFGMSADELRAVNGDLTQTACDAKLVVGGTVTTITDRSVEPPTTATSAALTNPQVCSAISELYGVDAETFVDRNSMADVTACATAVASGGMSGPYAWDGLEALPSPVTLAHRVYVEADGDPLATVGLSIDGTAVNAGGHLGVLDFSLHGDVVIDPTFELTLVDPETSADDGKIDLVEIAEATDAGELGDLIELDLAGDDIDAHFTIANDLIFSSPAHVDIVGDISALNNGSGHTFEFHDEHLADSEGLADDKIHVGHDLGDALALKDLGPADIIRMVAGLAEQIANTAGTSALDQTIPFIDVKLQDMVDFTADFAEIAEGVADGNPQDISTLEAILNDQLVAAGMPGEIAFVVTADDLALRFDASKSITRSYPFNFSHEDVSFAPIDGGATLEATAAVTFTPEVGIVFTGGGGITDRLFIRNADIDFDVELAADVFGSIALGPLEAAIDGNVTIGDPEPDAHELTISLVDPDNGDGRLTLAEIMDTLDDDPADLVDVSYGGPFAAELAVTTELGTGTLEVEGNLEEGITRFDQDFDFAITLSLDTFVDGSVEAARFVGRMLEKSDVITTEIPLIGDDLRKLTTVGTDIRTAADEMAGLWLDVQADEADFIADLDATIEAALEPAGCDECVEITFTDSNGDEVDLLSEAAAFEVGLHLGREVTETVELSGGLDFKPAFGVDGSISGEVTAGYQVDVAFGVNISDGFYFRGPGLDEADGDALQLYASLDIADLDTSLTLAGLNADVTDGAALISGGLGPDADAAGFAVKFDKLAMRQFSNRRVSVDEIVQPRFDVDVDVDLPMTTDVPKVAKLEVPVHLNWSMDGTEPGTPTLLLGCDTGEFPDICESDESVVLDAKAFVDNVIKPVLDALGPDADPIINPFALQEIQDALNSSVPVLDATLLDLTRKAAELAHKEAEFGVLDFFIQIGNGSISSDDVSGGIDLGWFQILGPDAEPDDAIGAPAPRPVASPPATSVTTQQSTTGLAGIKAKLKALAGGPASPIAISFPILDDPASAVKLVLGGQPDDVVTFIDFRTTRPVILGPQINWSATLFSLDIGFLKGGLTIAFNGGFGVIIDTGFGFDSSGFASGNYFDGFYLVDKPGNEVGLGGSVTGRIDGRFSVLGDIASVRFRGSAGVNLNAGLDLYDESPVLREGRSDGKLHIDEMRKIGEGHDFPPAGSPNFLDYLCMFRLGVRFDANLAFGGSAKVLGITVFDESWSDEWVLIDETYGCAVRTRIAQLKGSRLILNGGPVYAVDRYDGQGDIAEKFNVTKSGSNIVVEWIPAGGSKPTLTFPAADVTEIYGDLGTGNDQVIVDNAIGVPVLLKGGTGNDDLDGGAGADEIDGGEGNDAQDGGPGNDLLGGGGGNDGLTGGAGDDSLDGAVGNDTYTFANGWGLDEIVDASGNDTMTFSGTSGVTGDAAYGEATVRSGGNVVSYLDDEIDAINGSSAADNFVFKRGVPDGFEFDGRGGSDDARFELAAQERHVHVTDTGASGSDALEIEGTAAGDRFLMRAGSSNVGQTATDGFVAMFGPGSPVPVDRVDYDDSYEALNVIGGLGADRFSLDDNAAETTIDGGAGTDTFGVGQVFGKATTLVEDESGIRDDGAGGAGVADDDLPFAAVETTRGFLSNGVSHDATINGDGGEDDFLIYANKADIKVNGGDDNDRFTARAFVIEGSVELNGEGGVDDFEYVPNEQLSIDGGAGTDTYTAIGTEFRDGFVVDGESIRICPIDPDTQLPDASAADCGLNSVIENVESVVAMGLEGDDVFHVLSTSDVVDVTLFGSDHSDRFLVGDGALTGIQGHLTVKGEGDPTFDGSIPDPVVLPGEDNEGDHAPDPSFISGTDTGDVLEMDGSDDATGRTGRLNATSVTGLGMGDDVLYSDLEFAKLRLGTGNDTFTIAQTHVGKDACLPSGGACPTDVYTGAGNDEVHVLAVDDRTRVFTGGGDDTVKAGDLLPDAGGLVDDLDDLLAVDGGADDDHLDLDDTGDASSDTGTIDQGVVTGLGLSSEGVTHADVERLDVRLGTADEVVNVVGTSADTHVRGGAGNERYYVSDAADLANATSTDHLLGTLDRVDADLHVHAGAGSHLLMVSDEEAGDPNGTAADRAVIDENSMTGLADGDISYETDGNFAGGVTIWTTPLADAIDVEGTHHVTGVRTITSLNAGDGADDIGVSLSSSTDGFFVANGEEGNDVVDGPDSSLDLVVFGNEGDDDITTGSGDDLVLGDEARVEYKSGGAIVSQLGGGGPNDKTDGVARTVDVIRSVDVADGGSDDVTTGDGDDVVFGGTADDEIVTGADDDAALGGHGRYDIAAAANVRFATAAQANAAADAGDVIDTGAGEDFGMGQQGADDIELSAGDDVGIGGHNAADGLDTGDTIRGSGGLDLVGGDNALFAKGELIRLLNVQTATGPNVASSLFGDDRLAGEGADDDLFGQGGADAIFGGDGEDDVQGNHGNDCLMGGQGQDNLVGGGSATDGLVVLGIGNGLVDGDDVIHGDGAEPTLPGDITSCTPGVSHAGASVRTAPDTVSDVIAGDNARVSRTQHPISGAWVQHSYDGAYQRSVTLFDVAKPGLPAPDVAGSDRLYGDDGNDVVNGQGENDTAHGGAGDDVVEGNDGADRVSGGAGSDDIIGGGSAGDGVLDNSRTAAGLRDEGDTLYGDDIDSSEGKTSDAHDVMVGDNGVIERRLSAGAWVVLDPGSASFADRVQRNVTMADIAPGDTSGNDVMLGGGGDDDLYGQLDDTSVRALSPAVVCDGDARTVTSVRGDLLCGGSGNDGLVGDLGVIDSKTAEQAGGQQAVASSTPFIRETIRPSGTVVRLVTLQQPTVGGRDILLGGAGTDAVHAGAEDDLVNAGPGDDAVFGGRGADALWGGTGHDRLYGGHGRDSIDVKPRTTDIASWKQVAPAIDHDSAAATTNGRDLAYGGYDADALQADEGGAGPVDGDRLIDWTGAYNVYYVCNGAYGAGRVVNAPSPDMKNVVRMLADGDGAVNVTSVTGSGFDELALVDDSSNTNPKHPDWPGNFTCES
jgi:Ca2+-binding RTX toxin-like protein